MGRDKAKAAERIWSFDFLVLLFASLFAFVGAQALNGAYSLYLTQRGHSASLAGAVIMVFSVAAIVSRIATGYIIDRHGRRPMMVLGAATFSLACFLGALFPQVEALFPLRVLQGLGFAAVSTAQSTAAADVLPRKRLGEGLGYFWLGPALGMAVGPMIGTTLALSENDALFYLGTGALGALGLCMALTARYESHPQRLDATSACRTRFDATGSVVAIQGKREDAPKESWTSRLFVRSALPAAIPMFVVNVGFAVFMAYVPVFGTARGIEGTGWFFTAAAVVMVVVRLVAGRMFDVVPPRALFAGVAASGVCAFLVLLGAHDTWQIALAGAFNGLAIGVNMPLMNAIGMKCTDPAKWGAASAMVNIALDMGNGVGGVLWGAVVDAMGVDAMVVGGMAVVVLAFVVAMAVFPRKGQCVG